MKRAFALLALPMLAACVTTSADIPRQQPAAAPGSLVALGQPVQVGTLVVTPERVVEDSRCPENARCVWAGRLIVSARVDAAAWCETVPLTLGEPHAIHGSSITLISGVPERRADEATASSAYRFAFEGGE